MIYSYKNTSFTKEPTSILELPGSNKQLDQLEMLYTRHCPKHQYLPYETFYNFVLETMTQGIKKNSLENMFILLAETSQSHIKIRVNGFVKAAAEILALSEGDDDQSYMQQLSQFGLQGASQSESRLGDHQSLRRRLQQSAYLNSQNESCMLNGEFDYFDRIYQQMPEETPKQPQILQRNFGIFCIQPICITPTTCNFNPEDKEYKDRIQTISDIEVESINLSIGSLKKDRNPSILLTEANIAPIIQKENNQQITISVDYQELLDEYSKIKKTKNKTKSQITCKEIQKKQFDAGKESTKDSLQPSDFKAQYQLKVRMSNCLLRANPYKIRRRG